MTFIEGARTTFTNMLVSCGIDWDHRAEPRFRSSISVRLAWTDESGRQEIEATVVNISCGGAAIRTTNPSSTISTPVEISFKQGRRQRIIAAEVRGVHSSADGTTLIHLAFEE